MIKTELTATFFFHTIGPNLHVFLACGPMSDGYCTPVQQVPPTAALKQCAVCQLATWLVGNKPCAPFQGFEVALQSCKVECRSGKGPVWGGVRSAHDAWPVSRYTVNYCARAHTRVRACVCGAC